MDANQEHWSKPEADWLPLHRAPFYFFPKFAEPGIPWQREIAKLIRRTDRNQCSLSVSDDVAQIEHRGVRLLIDAGAGTFSIEAAIDENSMDWPEIFSIGSPEASPEDFIERVGKLRPLPEYRDGAGVLIALASSLWRELDLMFEEAVLSYRAQIMVQRENLWAPFEQMFPHQYCYFRFAPERRSDDGEVMPPTARGPVGELAFNPFVVGVSFPEDVEREKEFEAERLIICLWQDKPDLKKPDIIEIVRREYALPEDRIKGLWKDAARKYPDSARKPGRPRIERVPAK